MNLTPNNHVEMSEYSTKLEDFELRTLLVIGFEDSRKNAFNFSS